MKPLFHCTDDELRESVDREIALIRTSSGASEQLLESCCQPFETRKAQIIKTAEESPFTCFAIGRSSSLYPATLLELEQSPPVLFGVGEKDTLLRAGVHESAASALAIAGARRASAYGRDVAYSLGCSHSDADAGVVITGLALGVDGAATRGAIRDYRTNSVIGVLAGSPEKPYPPSHRRLHEHTARNGCVVSEIGFGLPGQFRAAFAARGRIIAALASCLVIVEAHIDSSAGMLVEHATALSRAIYAVPGPITSPLSLLPNRLIAEGKAKVVGDTHTLAEELTTTASGRRGGGEA